MKAEDYEVVKVIGRGAFGEVQLVGYCLIYTQSNTSFEIGNVVSKLCFFLSLSIEKTHLHYSLTQTELGEL